ncbi:MAG: hypothetical protein GYA26_01820, partial [Flexilinea flocculi]|nr:hypothetical protein [Flexilinea flocculi]
MLMNLWHLIGFRVIQRRHDDIAVVILIGDQIVAVTRDQRQRFLAVRLEQLVDVVRFGIE